jgi:hypothetical protein
MKKQYSILFLFSFLFSNMASQVKGQCTGWQVTPSSVTSLSAGGSNSFVVSATGTSCSYSAVVSTGANWINTISYSGGTVYYNIDPNTSCTPLTGYIYIYDGNLWVATDTVYEDVEASCCNGWTVTPSSDNFTDAGGSGSFEVSASPGGCNYSNTYSGSCIYNVSASGSTVSYDVYPNTTCTEQTGYIDIYDENGGFVAEDTITEYPAVSCCTDWQLSETYNIFPCQGGFGSFDVTTSIGGCEYTRSSPSWITTSASGGTVSYNVDTNTNNSPLVGYIYVYDGNGIVQGIDTIVEYGGCPVGVDEININNLNVFPNPSSGEFVISFETSKPEDIQIRIYDVLGQLIKEETAIKNTGKYSQQINLANVSKGIYILQIKAGDEVLNKKIEVN